MILKLLLVMAGINQSAALLPITSSSSHEKTFTIL